MTKNVIALVYSWS